MRLILIPLIFIITQSASAGFADDIAKSIFQKKVDQLYLSALSCRPLEDDPKSKIDVKSWIKLQPPLPEWPFLVDIETTAIEARKYARSIGGSDKVLHCLAGCFITKKLDYTSAVLVGWMKELSDVSDCSIKTSFEKKDYDATVLGAKAGESVRTCNEICKK